MRLSGLELEVLQLICVQDQATAPEVHREILKRRQTSYSTIKTAFDRLEKKGAIYRKRQVGRTSIYAAIVTEQNAQASLVKDFLQRVFPNDKKPLFNTLIRDASLSKEDIDYLEDLIRKERKR